MLDRTPALLCLMLAAGLAGCVPESSGGSSCGEGATIDAEGATACVYARQDAIIENGFRCPDEMPHRFEVDDAIICAAEPDAPVEAIEEAWRAGRGDRPEPEPEPAAEPEPRPDPEPEPRPDPEPEPRPDPEPEPDPRPDPRPEPDPEPAPDPEPGADPEPGDACVVGRGDCGADLRCLPTEPVTRRGRCAPAREGGLFEPCAGALDVDGDTCGAGLGCLEGEDGARCVPICDDTVECPFGHRCPGELQGGLCHPADDREFPNGDAAGACRPDRDDCAPGEGCQPIADESTYDGFTCGPAGERGPGAMCDEPEQCAPGTVCAMLIGWLDDGLNPRVTLYQFEYAGPARHPFAERMSATCRTLCGAELDPCPGGQICARLYDPTNGGLSIGDAFAHIGVCEDAEQAAPGDR